MYFIKPIRILPKIICHISKFNRLLGLIFIRYGYPRSDPATSPHYLAGVLIGISTGATTPQAHHQPGFWLGRIGGWFRHHE